jgi:hypothetical protein
MARRLDIASGDNFIEPPLGPFAIQIQPDDLDGSQAKLVARLLAPPHLSERQRASGIPSTVAVSMSVENLIQSALAISAAVSAANIPLSKGVLIRA